MERKEAYIEKIEDQLREWSAKINELKVQANLAKAGARDEYHRKIDVLKQRRKEISARLDELRGSGNEMWEEIEFSIEKGVSDMKKDLKDIIDNLKKYKKE